MFNSPALDAVIGLIFIFMLYSLLASAICEAIATFLSRRAATLYKGIRTMLTDTSDKGTFITLLHDIRNYLEEKAQDAEEWFVDKKSDKLHRRFYRNPIIKNYGQNILFDKPSYIGAHTFSEVLIQTLCELGGSPFGETADVTESLIKKGIDHQDVPAEAKKILRYHLHESAGDLNVFRNRLEHWYNDSMDRVGGWYKRNTSLWLFSIGLAMAITLNIDTIDIATYLSRDKKAREQLVQMASSYVQSHTSAPVDTGFTKEIIDSLKAEANAANTVLGLGWGDYGASDRAYYNDLHAAFKEKDWWIAEYTEKESEADSIIQEKEGQLKFLKQQRDSMQSIVAAGTDTSKPENKLRLDTLASLVKQTGSLQEEVARSNKERTRGIEKATLTALIQKYPNEMKTRYVVYSTARQKRKWLGFFFTAMAISLGAPFWFDLLNKLVNIRGSGKTADAEPAKKTTTSTDPAIDG